jgi:exocyst complex component 2
LLEANVCIKDAQIFYCLEAWIASSIESSATHYLEQIELFQRQLTTATFKLAGGVELSSSSLLKSSKQHATPQAFVSKIVKAFMDTLYAFLDGLVLLASDASPIVTGKRPFSDAILSVGPNSLDLLDLTDSVRAHRPFIAFMPYTTHRIPEFLW